MQPLQAKIKDLNSKLDEAYAQLSIDSKAKELAGIDEQLATSDIWSDVENAQNLSKQAASLRSQIEPWQALRAQVADIEELIALGDDSLLVEFEQQTDIMEQEFAQLKKDLLYRGEYDSHAAILKFSAGVGGTDAQDWCEMLERMYLRWADKSGMSAKQIERSVGEEAGRNRAGARREVPRPRLHGEGQRPGAVRGDVCRTRAGDRGDCPGPGVGHDPRAGD